MWKSLALFLPASVLLAVYVYIGQYVRLMGDDYCLIYYADRLGVLRSIWYWYLNWHGAYLTSFFDSFLVYFGESGMGWVVPVVSVLWLGGTAFSTYMLFPDDGHRITRLLMALALGSVLIVATLIWSPAIPQSLFWWSGMRGYVFPLVVVSYYPGLYLKFIGKERTSWQVVAWSLLSFGVLFLAGGLAETYTLEQLLFLLFFVVLGVVTHVLEPRGQAFRFLFAGLLGAFLSLVVMTLAPGNVARQQNFIRSVDVIALLQIALTGYGMLLGYIFYSATIWAVLAAALLGAIGLGMETGPNNVPRVWSILATLFAGMATPFACFLLFAYGMSEPMVARAAINAVYFLAASILYAGFLTGKLAAARLPFLQGSAVNLLFVVSTFVLLTFAAWGNGYALYSNRQAPILYAQNWDRSHAIILQARDAGQQVVSIPAVQNWTGVLEPLDNPKFYVNKCMSKYYGIQVLAVEASE